MKALRTVLLTLNTLCLYAICFLICLYYLSSDGQNTVVASEDSNLYAELLGYLMLATLALNLLSIIIALVNGKLLRKKGQVHRAGNIPFVFKLALIPFFIFFALLVVVTTIFGVFFAIAISFWIFLPILLGLMTGAVFTVLLLLMLVFGYLQIVTTSVHSTSDILYSCRVLNVHRGLRALYIILQFLPLADIISLPIITHYLNSKYAPGPQTYAPPVVPSGYQPY